MCKPRVPCAKPEPPPPFYRLHQKLPWTVAVVMGFQHCLAMIGGIVSVPLILGGNVKLCLPLQKLLHGCMEWWALSWLAQTCD